MMLSRQWTPGCILHADIPRLVMYSAVPSFKSAHKHDALWRSERFLSYRLKRKANVNVDASNTMFLPCSCCNFILFSYFSQKLWVIEVHFFGHLLSIPNEECHCAEFGRYFWDTLYSVRLKWSYGISCLPKYESGKNKNTLKQIAEFILQ